MGLSHGIKKVSLRGFLPSSGPIGRGSWQKTYAKTSTCPRGMLANNSHSVSDRERAGVVGRACCHGAILRRWNRSVNVVALSRKTIASSATDAGVGRR